VQLQGGVNGKSADQQDKHILETLRELKARLPKDYSLPALLERAKERTPFVVVCL